MDSLKKGELTKKSNLLGLLLGPVVFVSLLLCVELGILPREAWVKVVAAGAWMIIWWITEAVPIPVTALLPMVLFPLLGVFDMKEATAPYSDPIIYLFMGGFLIALAMERNKLHLRIALNLIKFTGTKPDGIILGFYISTAFLSMWISNTATAVMMLPIAMSIVQLIQKENQGLSHQKGFYNFAFALMLGIAYAANIGGVITIIGTPPNVVLVGFMQQFYEYSLDFNRWLLVGLPIGGLMLAIMYLLLVKLFYPSRLGNIAGSSEVINSQLQQLGPISTAEIRTSAILIFTAICWIFREPLNQLFQTRLLNDTIIAMVGGLLMFIVPAKAIKGRRLLEWKSTERLPWGILLLFGGGMCLAKGMEAVGIIQAIGAFVADNPYLSTSVLLLVLIFIMLFLTELMSNVALVTIFVPVVMGIADGLSVPVLTFVIPVTMASSFAFMLPISTPPNAILFSSGFIRIKEMMKVGVWLNLISILLLWLMAFTLIKWVY